MHIEANTFTISKAEARALVAFCCTDGNRPQINSVLFDPAKGIACATDGHTLVKVEGAQNSESKGASFVVARETLDRASKLAKKDDAITVNGAVSVGTIVLQYADRSDLTFPDYEQVIPTVYEEREIAPVFGLNPDYLSRLSLVSKACGPDNAGKTRPIRCQVSGDLDPVLYHCEGPDSGDWTIVIMPVRI